MVPPITNGGAMSGASSSWPIRRRRRRMWRSAATACSPLVSSKFDDGGGSSRRSGLPFHVTALLGPDLALALHDPLGGGQLGQAHGAAGVQLLGGNAHLGAQAQLAAVGEAGGGVHDHRGRIDLGDEALGVGEVVGQDRLGVPGGPGADVLDGVVQAVHHGHRQVQVHVFGGPVLLGGRHGIDRRRECGADPLRRRAG